MSRTRVGQRDNISERLTCLLRFLLLTWIGWLMCFVDSNSLRPHRISNSIIVSSIHMFTQLAWLLRYMWEEGVTFLLLIIHKMWRMLVYHLVAERKNLSSWIFPISYLSFLEILRVKIFVSHKPLFTIDQIMRISLLIMNLLFMDVVSCSLIHLIMILIHLLFTFISHRSLMIHLLMKWKLLNMSRHFKPSLWLCQVLVALRLAPLPIINLLNPPRLLITSCSHWKSIQFTVFASSTKITWSYHSCVGGFICGKHYYETKIFFFLHVC